MLIHLALTAALTLTPVPHKEVPVSRCALPGRTGWTDEGHDTDRRQFSRSTGVIRAVMLFVDFPDAPASGSTQEYEDALTPAAGWLRTASNGRARLAITPVRTWYRMPSDSTAYGFERGISYEQHQKYVRDAVAAADPGVDFSSYDIVYIVPPKNAAAVTFSPTYLYDPAAPGVIADGRPVRWSVTLGQDMWRWGYKVVDHETGHIFGLPDLYAFTGTDYHRFVGGWDVMGLISGPAPRYFGWHQWKLGWLGDDQVACAVSGRYRLDGPTRLVVVKTGETSAYAVEARTRTGLDARACSSGVLIYRVDSSVATGEGPIRVMDARPDQPPAAGCHQLDDAAYAPGQVFTDEAAGVRIAVTGEASVEVERLPIPRNM